MPDTRLVLLVLSAGADPVGPRTPLFEAETPTLDRIARDGHVGRVDLGARSLFEGFLALLGTAPGACSEAACCALGAGVALDAETIVARADLVTVDDEHLLDPTGGEPAAQEADALLGALDPSAAGVTLHRLDGGRSLACADAPFAVLPAPWEAVGRPLGATVPRDGPARELFDRSRRLLGVHDVNAVRLDLGENPANALWLHGAGPAGARPSAPPWARPRTALVAVGHTGAGIASGLGWRHIDGDGSAEDLCAAALGALAEHDVVVVHATAAVRPGAEGDDAGRAEVLGHLDARLAAPLLGALEERGPFVFAVAADGVFDTRARAFTAAPVPFGVLHAGPPGHGQAPVFSEQTCQAAGHELESGTAFAALLATELARFD